MRKKCLTNFQTARKNCSLNFSSSESLKNFFKTNRDEWCVINALVDNAVIYEPIHLNWQISKSKLIMHLSKMHIAKIIFKLKNARHIFT